ncbi:MAG: magnesium/cobalt transporter CorA [Thermomicrobiales bacterium]
MIHTMLCAENNHVKYDLSHEEIVRLLHDEQAILWLDLEAPSPEEVQRVAEEFNFHALAIEDTTREHMRPKVDAYDDYYFIVCYDIDYDEESHLIDEHALYIFLGKNYMVTIHAEPVGEIKEVAERLRRNLEQIERGAGVMLYSLLDTVIDHYFPVVDAIGDRIEELEANVFEQGATESLRDIFALKREVLYLRRVIAPERDALAVLARRELPIVSEAVSRYFQDIYEHVLRVTDAVDLYRDMLTSVLDSYLSANANQLAVASNNLNQVMKTLTSWSIILMSVTLIASIYGMNFDIMPELHFRFGYPTALLAMVVLAAILYRYFKGRTWL